MWGAETQKKRSRRIPKPKVIKPPEDPLIEAALVKQGIEGTHHPLRNAHA